jgi:hypothetical protein
LIFNYIFWCTKRTSGNGAAYVRDTIDETRDMRSDAGAVTTSVIHAS